MPHRAGSYFHLPSAPTPLERPLHCCAGRYRAIHEGVAGRARPSAGTHQKQLDRVLTEIEESPGLVLYTLLDEELTKRLEDRCRELSLPACRSSARFCSCCDPISVPKLRTALARSTLNAEYFKRIDAQLHDAA